MMNASWRVDSAVTTSILRVSSGTQDSWLVIRGDSADIESQWTQTHIEPCTALHPDGTTSSGIRVPRFHGGMLEEGLKLHEPLSTGQTVGVLQDCLAAVETAPRAPMGRTRMHRGGLARDENGRIRVIPCATAPLDDMDPSGELGEIAYLCLTGTTWRLRGVPVGELRPDIDPDLVSLVTELLERGRCSAMTSSEGPLTGQHVSLPRSLVRRLAAIGPSSAAPFIPAEPNVPQPDAVTAQLRVDAKTIAALESARSADSSARGRASTRAEQVGALRRTLSADQGQRTSGGQSRAIRRMEERRRTGILGTLKRFPRSTGAAAAVLSCGLIVGGGLLLWTVQTPDLDQPAVPAAANAAAHFDDPMAAFTELSELRARAYQTDDAALLAELTVPGSPAQAADAGGSLERFAGSMVQISVEQLLPPSQEGDSAFLSLRLRTSAQDSGGAAVDFGAQDVEVEMRMFGDRWLVYRIVQLDAR